MKVGILTINGFNCGSFLQAFALKKVIEQLNHEVYIIDTLKIQGFIKILAYPNPFSSFAFKKAYNFISEWKKQKKSYSRKKYDVIVIGSDVVWRDTNPSFKKFFGNDIYADKIITYAPCCSDTKYENLKKEQIEGIRNMDCLSARDNKTAELIEKVTGKKPPIVLDPTFLIDWSKYKVASNIDNFLLAYSYHPGSHPKNYRDMIVTAKDVSLKTGKKIVNAMENETWCDICIPAKPFEFLGLIKASDGIFTTSFHGTVFSLIYKKPFASFPGSHKVEFLLDSFKIEHNTLFSDYSKINHMLKTKREESIKYLKDSLES